jgi:fluoroacetyl-CoA thioesterase
MKDIFKPGDQKEYQYVVKETDVAAFHGTIVHRVMSTYSLAREMEWSTRLFVLDMRDDDEEGVGTSVSIDHLGPAFVGETITIYATIDSIEKNELLCSCTITVDGRPVATGTTGQKILKRERIAKLFKNE